MKTLEMLIHGGIGDNIIVRVFFDSVKSNYDQIRISHNRWVVDHWRDGDPNYYKFLDELGNILFTSKPYVFDHYEFAPLNLNDMANKLKIIPKKPDLDVLCKGDSLNLKDEYIVITTKIRDLNKIDFQSISVQLWDVLCKLSDKYKIVILGERQVEMSKEYALYKNSIYCIYDQIIKNLPSNRVLDLTVPSLGITVPNLKKIQQDCLIMKEAKFVVTIGGGGNFCMSIAVANTIGFNPGIDPIRDLLINPSYPSIFITSDFLQFLQKLNKYTKD